MAEFRDPSGHLHHDIMAVSVIIWSAFGNSGRPDYVPPSIRRDRTIATLASSARRRTACSGGNAERATRPAPSYATP